MNADEGPVAFCEECYKLTGNKLMVPVLDFAAMRKHLQSHQEPPDIEINVSPKGEIGFRWGEGLL